MGNICEKCEYRCCELMPVTLYHEEYLFMKRLYPKITEQVQSFGKVHLLKPPCPFFDKKTKLCTIYEYRPHNCRKYPIAVLSNRTVNNPKFSYSAVFITNDLSCLVGKNITDEQKKESFFWTLCANAYNIHQSRSFKDQLIHLEQYLHEYLKTGHNPRIQREILRVFPEAEYFKMVTTNDFEKPMIDFLESLKNAKL